VLDQEIKNLTDSFRQLIFDQLLLSDFTNIKTCWQQASKLIGLKKSLTSRSIEYWTIRGWDPLTAKFKAKEISKKIPSNSPFSVEHWIKKINPLTNTYYTQSEAEFERNKRRPIKKEYWTERGYSELEAVNIANSHKKDNDKKATDSSSKRSGELKKLSSNRSVEYWIMRGFSKEDAIKKISELQSTFSYEKCIKKYGEEEGKKRWSDRQVKWCKSLTAGGMKSGFSKISQELFSKLHSAFPLIEFGKNEKELTVNENSYMIDCIHSEKKKIIEFYGDYWHANPTKFDENKKIHKKTAREVWEKDKRKVNDLKSLGYEVLIIWESEFKSNQEETITKCIQFLST
jgi:G:T-mismatch repair DNA endonuclease (very short patch repair protein)